MPEYWNTAKKMPDYWQSVAEKATRFYAHGAEIFAECGEGVTCYVAECSSEQEAQTCAQIMEQYRSDLHK